MQKSKNFPVYLFLEADQNFLSIKFVFRLFGQISTFSMIWEFRLVVIFWSWIKAPRFSRINKKTLNSQNLVWIAFPSNTTHVLQSLDIAFFSLLKNLLMELKLNFPYDLQNFVYGKQKKYRCDFFKTKFLRDFKGFCMNKNKMN